MNVSMNKLTAAALALTIATSPFAAYAGPGQVIVERAPAYMGVAQALAPANAGDMALVQYSLEGYDGSLVQRYLRTELPPSLVEDLGSVRSSLQTQSRTVVRIHTALIAQAANQRSPNLILAKQGQDAAAKLPQVQATLRSLEQQIAFVDYVQNSAALNSAGRTHLPADVTAKIRSLNFFEAVVLDETNTKTAILESVQQAESSGARRVVGVRIVSAGSPPPSAATVLRAANDNEVGGARPVAGAAAPAAAPAAARVTLRSRIASLATRFRKPLVAGGVIAGLAGLGLTGYLMFGQNQTTTTEERYVPGQNH